MRLEVHFQECNYHLQLPYIYLYKDKGNVTKMYGEVELYYRSWSRY
jgi:hypothetical protein